MADAAAAMLQAEVSQLQSTVQWHTWSAGPGEIGWRHKLHWKPGQRERKQQSRQLERSAPGDAPPALSSPSRARLTGRTGRKRKRNSKAAATGKGA